MIFLRRDRRRAGRPIYGNRNAEHDDCVLRTVTASTVLSKTPKDSSAVATASLFISSRRGAGTYILIGLLYHQQRLLSAHCRIEDPQVTSSGYHLSAEAEALTAAAIRRAHS